MTQRGAPPVDTALWSQRIRAHDHTVVVSLLALGLRPDRAREIAQATWLRLIEQDAAGALAVVELPGLAIRQARFLALDAMRRDGAEQRRLLHDPRRNADGLRAMIERGEVWIWRDGRFR